MTPFKALAGGDQRLSWPFQAKCWPRRGARVARDAPPEQLHRVRRDAKELRYLLEFFRPLFPDGSASAAIRSLKGLQDLLGGFQDAEVQRDALLGMVPALEGKAPPETFVAIGSWIERLEGELRSARSRFAERFAAFASERAPFARIREAARRAR